MSVKSTVTSSLEHYHILTSSAIPVSGEASKLGDEDLTWMCETLGSYSDKWRDIAQGLCFTDQELHNIEGTSLLLSGAPFSYLRAMLSSWLQRAPGDVRGSTDYATRDALRRAVDSAGLGTVSEKLQPPHA